MSAPVLTTTECLIIADEAMALAARHIETCTLAERRLSARRALDEAEACRRRDAARPALRWACVAVQRCKGFASPAYAEVQAKYEVVYESHMQTA